MSHIFASNQESVPCSIRTLYNYIDQGYFTAINLDLPRKVRYKKRRQVRREPDNTGYRKDRSYQDFERYLEKFPDTNVVELDVVEGAGGKSEQVLLTMLFRNCSLMLIFLMEADRKDNVQDVFQRIYTIWEQSYIENSFRSFLQTMVPHSKIQLFLNDLKVNFYPVSFTAIPWLPGRRDVWKKIMNSFVILSPKGTTFAGLDQEQVTLITNHINSVARASLNGCTPFELALLLIDRKLLDLCQLERIPANQVILKPSLLKK